MGQALTGVAGPIGGFRLSAALPVARKVCPLSAAKGNIFNAGWGCRPNDARHTLTGGAIVSMAVGGNLSETLPRIPTPFYPSTVKAPADPLKLFPFLFKFISNPLLVVPEAVYGEKIVQYGRRVGRVAWVNDPALIKDVLLDRSELFPITPLQKRVFGPFGGKGVLTSEGAEWRWQRQWRHRFSVMPNSLDMCRRCPVPRRPCWQHGRRSSGGDRSIDKDMTRLTFRVISDTILPGGDEHIGAAIERASGDYFGPISWAFVYRFFHMP